MNGLLDTNILVYAVNEASPFFSRSRKFIEGLFEKNSSIYLCWSSIYEFLRVTTHPKVFEKPLKWTQSFNFISTLLESPQVSLLNEGANHLEALQSLLKSIRNPSGNLLHDCHIAAILKENGIHKIFTHDSDFKQFDFLEVHDPLK